MRYCSILDTNVNVTNMNETKEYIIDNLKGLKGQYICVSNCHTTVMSYENRDYNIVQNTAAMVLPDGKPLSVVSRLRGYSNAQRVTGPDLMEQIFMLSAQNNIRHYFYGSTEDTLEALRSVLEKRYEGISIAGMYSPPFRDITQKEDEDIIAMINSTKPDILWVGLGAPKQEYWMYNHKDKINALMIGVGAGFDYHADRLKRAPMWMQKCSLEWLYRLLQEPKRLFKRYFVTNFKFIYYVIMESICGKAHKK